MAAPEVTVAPAAAEMEPAVAAGSDQAIAEEGSAAVMPMRMSRHIARGKPASQGPCTLVIGICMIRH